MTTGPTASYVIPSFRIRRQNRPRFADGSTCSAPILYRNPSKINRFDAVSVRTLCSRRAEASGLPEEIGNNSGNVNPLAKTVRPPTIASLCSPDRDRLAVVAEGFR
jgi:hypothetical protein